VRKFSVKGKYDQYTLINFLTTHLPHLPRQGWLDDIKTGRMTINGEVTTPDRIVRSGIRIENTIPNCVDPIISTNIELLYDDDELMIINKPAPLPMHACGRFNRNNLLYILELAFPKTDFKIIHRLDADTTGVVVLGKNAKAATHLCQQFKTHKTSKIYLAIIHGLVKEDEFKFFDTIGKETIAAGARSLMSDGLESETHCKRLLQNKEHTLLQVEPKSGRTNQIRIHLAEHGHPIVGDRCYSCHKNIDMPLTLSKNELCLHAWKLSFQHPTTKQQLCITAPLPKLFFTKNINLSSVLQPTK
jgi:23S rRNA pseudouridine1911/1915/1917 synthase